MAELYEGTPKEAGMLPERIERIRAITKSWVDNRGCGRTAFSR